jgi:hypothetical protein
MGLDLSKPLSLKGFWGLITIRHHYLLETLFSFRIAIVHMAQPFGKNVPANL